MDRRAITSDAVAGLSVAALLLPEAIAYGSIAGFPPGHALIAALAGMAVYAVAGRSRVAIVAPTSASAATLAAAMATLAIADPAQRLLAAVAMVGFAGILFVLAGVFRLGFIAAFVSRPVLRGFAIGLAASIVIRQFVGTTGVSVSGGNAVTQLVSAIGEVGGWNGYAIAIAGAALAMALVLRRWHGVPIALVLLVFGVLLSWVVDLPALHVPVVGAIVPGFSSPRLPALDPIHWRMLATAALPLALIVFVESWGTMRSLALNRGDSIDPNRELVAIGFANIGSALVGGQAVGAGFSASSANDSAGARSRCASMVALVGLALLMWLALPLVARVPVPVLAAVVVAALLHALDPSPLRRLWRIDRDQYVALAAALGVLLLGVLNGMLLAVGLSVLAIVRKISSPEIVELGRLGDGRDFVDRARHPESVVRPDILVLRPGEPLFFANAERIMAEVERRAAAASARTVVLSLEESSDLDSTALDVLGESSIRLTAGGRALVLARLKDPVRDLLNASGPVLIDLANRSVRSVADAVDAASRPHHKEPGS
ncbi:SulP family inorganic anion transporter [Sphingomonas sp. GB1N7]|uniref:SulP family inorganic anion transporter n=1 Tax=Parasphingomonas caseinilytica TaxID=3096158 RepID=UPI002FC9B35A